jgi:hypothetical protein
MTKIRFELAPKPTKAEKATQGETGFLPVATRWGKRTVKCIETTVFLVYSLLLQFHSIGEAIN